MERLTSAAEQAVRDIAWRYSVSEDAVHALLDAVVRGGGTMAQFYHNELGGGGQWMSGGMTMVGDMFNSRLQSTVSGICSELSNLYGSTQLFEPPQRPAGNAGGQGYAPFSSWYPAELGAPSSSGSQNDLRYAVFPGTRRLAVERAGQLAIYDTLDHMISGVQQQQSGYATDPTFSSQRGTFTVSSLPRADQAPPQQQPAYAPAPVWNDNPPPMEAPRNDFAPAPQAAAPAFGGQRDALDALERLADLHARGVLTQEEFAAKKAELLSRV